MHRKDFFKTGFFGIGIWNVDALEITAGSDAQLLMEVPMTL